MDMKGALSTVDEVMWLGGHEGGRGGWGEGGGGKTLHVKAIRCRVVLDGMPLFKNMRFANNWQGQCRCL